MFAGLLLFGASLVVNPQEVRTIQDSYICGGITNFNQCTNLTARSQKGETEYYGLGSGFFISTMGDILTNEHVVKDAEEVIIIWNNSAWRADVVAVNREKDLAHLRIHILLLEYTKDGAVNTSATKGQAPIIYPLSMPLYNALKVGQSVYVVGYPIQDSKIGLNPQVTKGIISNLEGLRGLDSDFQVDAQMDFGNSGGPVVDSSGRVIGVAAHGFRKANYAIKFEAVRSFLGERVRLNEEKTARRLAPERMLKETMRAMVLVLNYKKNDGTIPNTDETDSVAAREGEVALRQMKLGARLEKVRGNWENVKELTDDLRKIIPGDKEVRELNDEARDKLGLHMCIVAEANGCDVPAHIEPLCGITNQFVLCGEPFPVVSSKMPRGFPVRAKVTYQKEGKCYVGFVDEVYNWHGTKEIRVVLAEQVE